MKLLAQNLGLYTDFYEFTMAQAFFLTGKHKVHAAFDYFYRKNPFGGGYVVYAGLQDLLELLEDYSFSQEQIEYLEKQGLKKEFLEYLKDFKFQGSVWSMKEGEVVFPHEPIVRVEGNIVETQLIETLLLNILNYESLIATKASRIKHAAGGRRVVDFGLRRAQGFGGIQASRAAIIGGVDATSNVYAAYRDALEVTGTQAHSWIQCFDDELNAFRKFAEIFPNKCFLLVDTYNTLESGVPHAITVAGEMEKKGHRLSGIRLDSGDLAYLSKKARMMLDDSNLPYVKIVASNQLDEYVIRSLIEQEAPIDAFGVGTRLVTAHDSPALDGVYKLSAFDGKPRLKFSENFAKITLPGVKKVRRFYGEDKLFYADGILLDDEESIDTIYHPLFPTKMSPVKDYESEIIMNKVMNSGKMITQSTVAESAKYAQQRLNNLSAEHRRFENPHIYKVGISEKLLNLRSKMMNDLSHRFPKES